MPTNARAGIASASPTHFADTPPGSVLDVRGTWRQDGAELALVEASIYARGILARFRVTNLTANEKPLRYSLENFSAIDNLGRPVPVGFSLSGNRLNFTDKCSYPPLVLPALGVLNLGAHCDAETWSEILALPVDTSNHALVAVFLRVSEISGIHEAQWRIPTSP